MAMINVFVYGAQLVGQSGYRVTVPYLFCLCRILMEFAKGGMEELGRMTFP